jgi:uncharacterized protein YegL
VRRAAILATRGLIVLALAAAVANLPLPGRSRARVRVHLIDRSGSVLVPGAPESLTPADARRIVEWDLRRAAASGDRILWASFGREVAFESETVDPEESRLDAALEAALARDPTEIVLHTDGRADPGRALLLCRARGVPVHVFPLGPVNPRDARIADVRAPAALAPGERGTLEARLESTFETTLTVRLDGEARSVPVAPGAPSRVSFPDRPAGPFRLRLEPADACPQNDAAEGEIFVRSDAPRTLILSTRDFPAPEGFEARRSAVFEDPRPYDAVIVDGFPLNAEDAASLAAYVRDFGGALLLLGGPGAGGLPPAVAEISPLFPGPDRRVAAVFLIDASGSMKEGKLDAVLDAVRRAWARFGPGDSVAAVPFPNLDLIRDPLDLRRIRAEGGTFIAGALEKARLHLEQVEADRKQIFLLTDGETHPDEKAEERLLQGRELERRGIALTVVTTNRLLEIGENVRIEDWKSLDRALDRLLRTVREDYLAAPTPVEFADHPATAGLGRAVVPGIHRLRARPDAQVLGRAGRPPDVLPALAVRREGRRLRVRRTGAAPPDRAGASVAPERGRGNPHAFRGSALRAGPRAGRRAPSGSPLAGPPIAGVRGRGPPSGALRPLGRSASGGPARDDRLAPGTGARGGHDPVRGRVPRGGSRPKGPRADGRGHGRADPLEPGGTPDAAALLPAGTAPRSSVLPGGGPGAGLPGDGADDVLEGLISGARSWDRV